MCAIGVLQIAYFNVSVVHTCLLAGSYVKTQSTFQPLKAFPENGLLNWYKNVHVVFKAPKRKLSHFSAAIILSKSVQSDEVIEF